MGLTYKSKAQSSCGQVTIISEVDCPLQLVVYCNYTALNCNLCSPCTFSPFSLSYSPSCCDPADPNKFNIQSGNIGNPSITTLSFNGCANPYPCSPFEFEIFGYGFTLTGNTWFDDNHTWEHLGIIGLCCPSGITVTWDVANCTIYLLQNCP